VTQDYSELSTGSESLSKSARRIFSGCDWTQLLRAEGGPGESPGREVAVAEAVAAVAEKRRVKRELEELKMKRKRKGR
jgi:hypothetical protein